MDNRTDTEKCLNAIEKLDSTWYVRILKILARDNPNAMQEALGKAVDENIDELKAKYPGYPNHVA